MRTDEQPGTAFRAKMRLHSAAVPPIITPRQSKTQARTTDTGRQTKLTDSRFRDAPSSSSSTSRRPRQQQTTTDPKKASASTSRKQTIGERFFADRHNTPSGSPGFFTPVQGMSSRPAKKARRSYQPELGLALDNEDDDEDGHRDDFLMTAGKENKGSKRKGQLDMQRSPPDRSLAAPPPYRGPTTFDLDGTSEKPVASTSYHRPEHVWQRSASPIRSSPVVMHALPLVEPLEADGLRDTDADLAQDNEQEDEEADEVLLPDSQPPQPLFREPELPVRHGNGKKRTRSPSVQSMARESDAQEASSSQGKSAPQDMRVDVEEETMYPDFAEERQAKVQPDPARRSSHHRPPLAESFETIPDSQAPLELSTGDARDGDADHPSSASILVGDSQLPAEEIHSQSVASSPRQLQRTVPRDAPSKKAREAKRLMAEAMKLESDESVSLQQSNIESYFTNESQARRQAACQQALNCAFKQAYTIDIGAGVYGRVVQQTAPLPADDDNLEGPVLAPEEDASGVAPAADARSVVEETEDERDSSDLEKSPVKWSHRLQERQRLALLHAHAHARSNRAPISPLSDPRADVDVVPSSQRLQDEQELLLPPSRPSSSKRYQKEESGSAVEESESLHETHWSQLGTIAKLDRMDDEFEGRKNIIPISRTARSTASLAAAPRRPSSIHKRGR